MYLRLFILLALITSAAPVTARADVSVPVLALDHIGIQAADLDRSTAFYVGVLGLTEVPAPFPRTVVRWIALGSGRMLHIVDNGESAVERNRWDHIALACADLDAMIAYLNERGIAWTDMAGNHHVQTRPDSVRQIFIRDPDGYSIEVNDAGKSR